MEVINKEVTVDTNRKATVAAVATINKPTVSLLMDSPAVMVEDSNIHKLGSTRLLNQPTGRLQLEFLPLPNGNLLLHPMVKSTTTMSEEEKRLGKNLPACRKKMASLSLVHHVLQSSVLVFHDSV